MKPQIPLTCPAFVWIAADADSTNFRERQRARMQAAQKPASNVKPIQPRKVAQ